jgi:hypothetical protein
MSIHNPGRTRAPTTESATHMFSVGQIVRMRSRSGVFLKTDEIFRVTRTLPARDNLLQYRLRSESENYERVATEDNLELVGSGPVVERAADPSWAGWTSTEASATAKGGRASLPGRKRK